MVHLHPTPDMAQSDIRRIPAKPHQARLPFDGRLMIRGDGGRRLVVKIELDH